MKCPHCLTSSHDDWDANHVITDGYYSWGIKFCKCPECKKATIILLKDGEMFSACYPKASSRAPLPKEVPEIYSKDYLEACNVIAESEKASAALSRRCLQAMLRDLSNTKSKDLFDQIEEVITAKSLPSYITESLDAVRAIGNFAAHPLKSKSTGAIVDVEPGEAEWTLDTIEALFDFYFVQPVALELKRDALNKKLQDAGKPLLRTTL